jgi:hypothetical protein
MRRVSGHSVGMTGEFNRLELRPTVQRGAQAGSTRRFLDLVVDGRSLYDSVERAGYNYVSRLGWGEPAWRAEGAAHLLGRLAPELPGGRTALYICGNAATSTAARCRQSSSRTGARSLCATTP